MIERDGLFERMEAITQSCLKIDDPLDAVLFRRFDDMHCAKNVRANVLHPVFRVLVRRRRRVHHEIGFEIGKGAAHHPLACDRAFDEFELAGDGEDFLAGRSPSCQSRKHRRRVLPGGRPNGNQ